MYTPQHRRRVELDDDQLRESLEHLKQDQERHLTSLYDFRDKVYLRDASLAHLNYAVMLSKRVITALDRSINEVGQ